MIIIVTYKEINGTRYDLISKGLEIEINAEVLEHFYKESNTPFDKDRYIKEEIDKFTASLV